MKALYVDNYRGFDTTWIPIEDVNFLVGENSTGKTSILSLINVLVSWEFWYFQEFNNSEVELGAFKDIVSAGHRDVASFSVGAIECPDDSVSPSDKQSAFLMTFVQRSGMPRLKEWSFVTRDHQVRIAFGRKVARYIIEPIVPHHDLASTLEETFRTWLREPIGTETGCKQLRSTEIDITKPLIVAQVLGSRVPGEPGENEERKLALPYPGPEFALNLTWLAPVRSKPARIYSGLKATYSPEGEHTPHTIRSILGRKTAAAKFREFIEPFGKESHLFETVYTRSFGRSFASPFELGITLNGARIVLSDVGYGVSQVLPILVEMFSGAGRRSQRYALQQPEVHLHPRAQAALGEVILELAAEYGAGFFIETHSDYLIDRFRLRLHEKDPTPSLSSQVLYFEREDGMNKVHAIPILSDGRYDESQPEGFRSFFIHEQLSLLGL